MICIKSTKIRVFFHTFIFCLFFSSCTYLFGGIWMYRTLHLNLRSLYVSFTSLFGSQLFLWHINSAAQLWSTTDLMSLLCVCPNQRHWWKYWTERDSQSTPSEISIQVDRDFSMLSPRLSPYTVKYLYVLISETIFCLSSLVTIRRENVVRLVWFDLSNLFPCQQPIWYCLRILCGTWQTHMVHILYDICLCPVLENWSHIFLFLVCWYFTCFPQILRDLNSPSDSPGLWNF